MAPTANFSGERTDDRAMGSRTEFGIHLSLTSGLVGVWTIATLVLGEIDWRTGVVTAALALSIAVGGARLVVTRGKWSPALTATDLRRAAFFGVAWGPAAMLAMALWGTWPLALGVLPVPAVLAVAAVVLWRGLPEPVRSLLRRFRDLA
jgi:hypothetical protein